MAGSLGNLVVQISGDVARLRQDMAQARGTVERAMKGIRTAASVAGKALAALGAGLSVGALVGFTRRSAEASDRILKLSERLGISTEALSEYQLVAERSGVEFRSLTVAFQRMTRRVSEAAQGTGTAKDALKELGVDAKKLNQLSPDQQFEALADAFQKVGTQSDKVRLAFKLFDTEGVGLLQTMQGGAAAIRAVREEAQETGDTLSLDTAKKAAALNDEFANLDSVLRGAGNAAVDEFAPALKSIIDLLNDVALDEGIRKLSRVGNFIQEVGSKAAASVADFLGFEEAARSLGNVADDAGARIADSFAKSNKALTGTLQEQKVATEDVTDETLRLTKAEEEARKAAERRAQALKSAQKGVLDSLRREVAGVKDLSRQQQIIFQLEQGRLRGSGAGFRRQALALAQQADAQRNLLELSKMRAAAQEQLKTAQESTINQLERQIANVQNLSNEERALYELREGALRGSAPLREKEILALARQADQQARLRQEAEKRKQAEQQLAAEVKSIQESTRTDAERQEAQLKRLTELYEKGAINAETYERAVKQAKEATSELGNVAEDLGLTFSSALEEAITQGKSLSDVLKGIEKDILRILTRKLITEPLAGAVTGGLKNLIPGFRDGGSFTIGGSGGPDSQLVAFFGSPGEQVTVSPRGSDGGSVQVSMNVYGATNPDEFVRNADQIAYRASVAAQRAFSRNG